MVGAPFALKEKPCKKRLMGDSASSGAVQLTHRSNSDPVHGDLTSAFTSGETEMVDKSSLKPELGVNEVRYLGLMAEMREQQQKKQDDLRNISVQQQNTAT